MEDAKLFTIKIESILGGQSPMSEFARSDQFRASIGIDPSLPINELTTSPYSIISSGYLRPTPSKKFSGAVLLKAPRWILPQPKSATVYVYDAQGSLYSTTNFAALTAIADGGSLTGSVGNGAEYYDNYLYLAKNTDIARYGPLNGVPEFDGSYWDTTLAKSALVDTDYPLQSAFGSSLGFEFPNHILKRHSDGRLYIADVVGNTGTIHFIQTSKTAVEGDTNNGSTEGKLVVGYGLWPTAMESYGSDLVIAFYEGTAQTTVRQSRAKIAFWDTTSTNVNKLVWVEYPDPMITAIKNINGILYFASYSPGNEGWRITRFVGGYTFEDVLLFESGTPPAQGAIDGDAIRLLLGGYTRIPENMGCVWSYNLRKSKLVNDGLFNVMGATGGSTVAVTTLKIVENQSVSLGVPPTIGWSDGTNFGLDTSSAADFGTPANVWWSQTYRIGKPFKIRRIIIPLARSVAAGVIITPTLYFDNGETTKTLTEINNTNYPNKNNIIIRPENAVGNNNFWLGFRWSGTIICTIALPITIEYEILPYE